MFADGQQKTQGPGVLSRSGPALAVIGIHIILIYAISASMGVVPIPNFKAPLQAVFIPETASKPDPAPLIEPEIDIPAPNVVPPMPMDMPVVPPVETDVAPMVSNTAITTAQATATPGQMQDLKTKQRVDPIYPPSSRRAGEEGTVRLRVLVDERGRPSEVQVMQGSGFGRLDEAAIDAVRRWRFQAANNGSAAVSAWTQVAITFKLTDNKK
jgi:protein TonB